MYVLTNLHYEARAKAKEEKASNDTEQGYDKSLTEAPQGCTYLQKLYQTHFLKI